MQLLQQTIKRLSRVTKSAPRLGVLIAFSLMVADGGFSQEAGPAVPAVDDEPASPSAAPSAGGEEQNTIDPGFGGFGFGGAGGLGGAGEFGGRAMGLPESAIPGRKWVAGDGVILAISDDGKKVFAYSKQHPRWTPHDLTQVPGCAAIPIIGDVAAVRLGHYCYAYSPELGTWDVLKLPEGEAAIPVVGDDGVYIHSASQGDYVFKSSWGKWFSAEEIKAGRVAEYLLAQRDTKAAGEPVRSEVVVFPLKFADATDAERIIEQLLRQNGRNLSLAVDVRTNSLLVNADEELVREVKGLIQILDAPGEDTNQPNPPSPRPEDHGLGSMPNNSRDQGDALSYDFGTAKESVDELRENFNRLEAQTRELAAKLHGPSSTMGTARKAIEKQLRETVPQAFQARQKFQRAELAEFARRLQGIQQSIEMRDRLAQQIIDRRVEELLEPSLKWERADSLPALAPDRSVQVGPSQASAVASANSHPTLGEGEIQLIANHKQGHLEWLTKPGKWTLIGTDARMLAPFGSQLKLRWSGIPSRGDATIFVTVEIPDASPDTIDVLLQNPLSLSLTSGPGLDPLFNGERLTKVHYLPHDLTAVSGSIYKTLSSFLFAPGVDPVIEAKKLGTVVAVMRFSLDAEQPVVSAGESVDPSVESQVLYPELEGTWEAVDFKSTEKTPVISPFVTARGLMIIRGNRMIHQSVNWPASEQRFTCDTKATPQKLTMFWFRDGKESISRSIVEVSGDTLRRGTSMNGSSEFPESFEAPRTIIQVYRRVPDVESGTVRPHPGVDGAAVSPVPVLNSPQVVLQLMYDLGARQDYAGYISLFTDDEASRLAGMLLRSAAVFDVMSQLSARSAEQGVDLKQAYSSKFAPVLEHFRKEDPPAAALSAYEELVLYSFPDSLPRPAWTAEDYSAQLRSAAGILTDARKFCVEMMKALSTLNPPQAAASKRPHWQIEITADGAVATSDMEASEPTGKMNPSVIKLRRIGGQWRISSFMSDEQILEFAKGLVLTGSRASRREHGEANSLPFMGEAEALPFVPPHDD